MSKPRLPRPRPRLRRCPRYENLDAQFLTDEALARTAGAVRDAVYQGRERLEPEEPDEPSSAAPEDTT